MSVLVRNAWHAVGMARTAEAVLVAAGVGLVTAAAAVAEGLPLRDPVTWCLAVAAGAATGVSWFVDLRPRAGVLARRIDRGLRLDGALVTAWELESRGVESPLARLLARGVRRRVRSSEAVRAALPPSGPILAVPFLGASLLAWVCGLRADEGGVHVQPALAAAVGALQEAEGVAQEELSAGAMSAADLRELAALTRRARELAAEGERVGDDPARAAGLRRELADLAEGIDELAHERGARPELARALDRAAACADAAGEGLGAAAKEDDPALAAAGGTDDDAPGSGADGARSETAAGGAADGTPGETGERGERGGDLPGGELALAGADGTMSAPSNGDEAPPTRPDPGPSNVETDAHDTGGAPGGVALDRWWPARHATLAGRWIESRRARAGDAATTPNQDSD